MSDPIDLSTLTADQRARVASFAQREMLQALAAVTVADPSDNLSANSVSAAPSYNDVHSFQTVSADLNLGTAAGTSSGSKFLAAVMGNVINLAGALTKTGNYLAGLIGHYSLTSGSSSTYPKGAVLAGIGDGTTDADGAVVAYIDGDDSTTTAGAAFKVRSNNSTAASGFNFGLDLQDAAHDGYQPVDASFYKKAPLRLVSDVVELVGAGAPTNGGAGTGLNVAGPGSRYTDITNKNVYINVNTKASPTWQFAAGATLTAPAATLNQVAAAAGTVTFSRLVKVAKVALAAADTGGGVLSWVNPEAGAIIISKIVIDVTTVASSACSIDVGTTAVNGTTQSDNLIDGLEVHNATGSFDQTDQAGANGKTRQRLAAGAWVTASKDSGAAAALVGFAYISYINV